MDLCRLAFGDLASDVLAIGAVLSWVIIPPEVRK